MTRFIFLFFYFFIVSALNAATISTPINSSSYTQILGPGGTGYLLSAYQPMQCLFSSTMPSVSAIGHSILQTQQTSIDSIGGGVYLWCKSSAAGLNYATITAVADAATWGNNAGSGGGGTSGNVNLNKVGGTTYALGQALMSNSMPVVLPSNQSAIPVTQSGTWNINNISGTISLPAGAATNTGITGASSKTLTDINTTLGTPLQAGGNVVVTSAPTTAVTNAGLSNLDVALSTRLKPADTLTAVTTVGTITNPVAVTGTFWQTTQPVSGTVTTTPSGTQTVSGTVTANAGTNLNTSLLAIETGGNLASVATNTTNLNNTIANAGSTPTKSVAVQGISGGVAVPVSGTVTATQSGTWNITNVSGTVSLPTGAAIAVKQPALGTAGSASADVITVQGVASMTALKVDGSAVTQPVSGTFWQATQPISGTVAATQSGTWTMQPGNTANTTPWLVTSAPGATGVAANSPSQCESTAYEASHVCKASAGVIYRLVVYNSKASAQFFQIFNTTSVPSDTAVPVTAPMNCPATSNCTYDFGDFGYSLATGISVSNSSTGPTKTIGSADSWFSVAYK